MIKYSQENSSIETERLILRQPSENDVKDIVRNLSNLEVTKWLLVVPYPYTEEDAKWFINHCKEKLTEKPRKEYVYWIELKPTKEVIGGIGLSSIKDKKGIVGYWLGTAHHGNKYGSEALEALIDLAFNRLKLNKLEAGVFDGNPSSGKLLEKFGFEYKGVKGNVVCKADGQTKKELFYELSLEKYLGAKK